MTPSAYDIPTAFVAVFDSGRRGPVVSFNAEYGELDVFLSVLVLLLLLLLGELSSI